MTNISELPDTPERLGDKGSGGSETFGIPGVPGKRYRCARHGVMLGREVVWRSDGLPHCPKCDAQLVLLADESP